MSQLADGGQPSVWSADWVKSGSTDAVPVVVAIWWRIGPQCIVLISCRPSLR